MIYHFSRFAAILLLLCFAVTAIRAEDDKSSEHRILVSEKNHVEKLIKKAGQLEAADNDSCLVPATEAMRLARAYGAFELQAKAQKIICDFYYARENYKEALKQYSQLLVVYAESGDSLSKAVCYNSMGVCYFHLGVYDKAIRAYHSSMQIAQNMKNKEILARCYQNIGVLYEYMKRFDEAMSYYKKALDFYQSFNNKSLEADIMLNMGNIYDEWDQYKDARAYYLSALKIYESLKDDNAVGNIYLNLGNLYEDLHDYNKSLDYYNKSLVLAQKDEYIFGLAYAYISMGSVYNKTKQYQNAIKYLQKSLEYSERISLLENIADCHGLLAEAYAHLGYFESAYNEKLDYEKLHDSIFNQNVNEQIAELEMRYQTKLKDAEISNLKLEREKALRDKLRRTIGLAGIALLTLLVVLAGTYYSRILQKSNSRLTKEVDERTRAQQELITIKENLEVRVTERTRELEKAKLKAEESDKLKSAFIANMSHEIRTPLNAITGFSGLLLREDISSEKKQEYNDQIIKNNRILVNMIEDLIDTSRIESGSLQLHPSTVNPEQILAQLNEPIFENMAKKNKPYIEIIQEKADIRTPTIYADAVRVHQVLWHLIDNAIKFTNKGTIKYGCYENHTNIVFYVDDTGIGIPEESRTVIFEKFRQLDESARRKYGGTGLGLYYAKKIAEMMGGTIWFEPKKEGGSIFYFSIPVTQK
jgi:signal transduction histidine kinase